MRRALILTALVATLVVGLSVWRQRGGPLRPAPCVEQRFEGSTFTVCQYDSRRDMLRLASRTTDGRYLRTFSALNASLGRDARHVRFAMNAGMFNDQGAPIGLYVQSGDIQQRLRLTDGPGNFHLKPNGVFYEDDRRTLRVVTSEKYDELSPSARWATQSGPMLVINNSLHPAFAEDGASRLIRNGVGVADAHTAYFVVSNGPVSFGRFARFFRDGLLCRDALFLDGVVSSLWIPGTGREDRNHLLGPMAVVLND